MSSNPATIDEYLAPLPGHQREALEELRRTIKSIVPDAEEVISYGLPAFRYRKRMLVGFGATTNHCAFYPMSSTIVETLRDDLSGYFASKGTIRFQPEEPLSAALVEKLVRARINEAAT